MTSLDDTIHPPEDVGPVEKPAAAVGEAEAAQAEGQVRHDQPDPEWMSEWMH